MNADARASRQLEGLSANEFTAAAWVLLRESGCTVRKWRSNLTGCAYTRDPDWGIVSPKPTTAAAFSVFAHEVGHQMLHRVGSLPRWLEEVQAWEYALDAFDRFGLPGREDVERRAERSIGYAFGKAMRRGLPASKLYANEESRWWAERIGVREEAA